MLKIPCWFEAYCRLTRVVSSDRMQFREKKDMLVEVVSDLLVIRTCVSCLIELFMLR